MQVDETQNNHSQFPTISATQAEIMRFSFTVDKQYFA